MNAIITALAFAANTVIDADTRIASSGLAKMRRTLRSWSLNFTTPTIKRVDGRTYFVLQMTDHDAEIVAAELAVNVYATNLPTIFAVDTSRAGVQAIEGLSDRRADKLAEVRGTDANSWLNTKIPTWIYNVR